jgi:PAS domain S-box-containing protein
MQWEYSSFSLPLLITAIVSAALAVFASQRRAIPGANAFMVLMAAVSEWSLGYAMELGSASLPAKLFWARVEYIGIVIVPVAWFIFSIQFTGLHRLLTLKRLVLLAVLPALTFTLVWTNQLHGLIWSSIQIDPGGLEPALVLSYGAGFWLHTVYSYLLIFTGTVLLIRFYLRARKIRRQQIRTVLLAVFVPWLCNAIYIFGINPLPNLDLTPLAFAITGILFAWAFIRLQFLDIVPLARGAIMESMRDAVIVLDAWDRIKDFNRAAEAITNHQVSQVIGAPATQVFADYPEMVRRFGSAIEAHEVLVGGDALNPVYFDLRISPLYDRDGQYNGRLVVLQDITAQERAKLALQKSHAELDLRVQERTAELNATNQDLQKAVRVREAAEKALRERIEMERLVSSISTKFINLMVEDIDEEISHSLQTIGEFAGVDYSYVFRISPDGRTIAKTHEWSASGIPLQKDNLEIPCTSLGWWMGRLNRREEILIPRYATLPMEARQEKELLRSKSVHSLIAVPLVHCNALIGFLGFDSSQREKIWANEDTILLRMVGETFANAFARKNAEAALRASDAELRAVFAAMNDQVLICDRSGRIQSIPPTYHA